MALIYSVMISLFLKTTLCQNVTDDFSISVTEHITGTYGDCINIPYKITFPSRNVTGPYTIVWFSRNIEKKEVVSYDSGKRDFLRLLQLPPGEHQFGFRLEWGHNKSYTFAETVRISVSGALTKRPDVTMDKLIAGRPATLRCTAPYLCNMDISPQITWKGANVIVLPPNRSVMRLSPSSSEVQMTPKAEDHNTNITCQLRYKYTMSEKTITLNVQYPPKILDSSKCILKGQNTFCQCISQGNPIPTINWFVPISNQSIYNSNQSQNVKEIVLILWPEYHNSTIQCISSNYLGKAIKNLYIQNPTSLTNLTEELSNNTFPKSESELTVPWIITGVSLCLNLILFTIVVICQYRQAHKKKCSGEVKVYASLSKPYVEQEYSVISLQPQ